MADEKVRPPRADRLRQAVEVVGNQVQTAKLVGVSPRQFRKYLSGEVDPPTEVLTRVAEASGYSLEWLITGAGPSRQLPDAAISLPGNVHAVLELRLRLHAELSDIYAGSPWPFEANSTADEFLLMDSTREVSCLPVDLWDRGVLLVATAHRAALARTLRKNGR